MKKICILIFMMIFITGCTIKCDLRIDTNLKVRERLTITENNKVLGIYNDNLKIIPEQRISEYENIEGFKQFKLKEELFGSDYTGGVVEAKYNSLDEFKKSGSFTSLFSSLSVSEASNVTSVVISDLNYSFFESEGEPIDINDIELNIRFHNKVANSNAKSYDEKTNTYTWLISPNNETTSISFDIDKNNKRWDIIMEDFFNDNLVSIIVVSILIIIASIITIRFYVKNKNANKI